MHQYFFIFISVSGVLFLLLKYDLIYEYNYNFYPITERTSLEIEEIREINNKIKNYFFDESEYLDVSIFNDKEIYHMKDVKEIINNIFFMKIIINLFVLITLLCVKRYKLNVYSVFKLSSIIYTFIVITI